ncbi:polyprenyl glycosylphosphotransferase [Paraoerskovia sediminicola]|uniref:Polyprenyl glycosylphosphotransferase n=1 Tax=Paraoerskovia sediminicola TaxID=1138587 RepID=A0ABN6XCK1_9CELL|nr:sugar transferase [Paraoerskovia sediminicola]BDZ42667.1 polyprenyl glycosylphosphotransferase [Paraoerskovia sediminicola]
MSGIVTDVVSDVRGRLLGAHTVPGAHVRSPISWIALHRRRIAVTDSAAVVLAMLVTVLLAHYGVVGTTTSLEVLSAFAGVIATAWIVGLSLMRTRDVRVLGRGPAEYQRVFLASWWLFASIAVVSYVTTLETSRGFVLVAFPLGLGAVLVSRLALRGSLRKARAAGVAARSVVAVGRREQVSRLVHDFHDDPMSGYRVIGVCIPGAEQAGDSTVAGVPVLGDLESAASVVGVTDTDCVAVAGSDAMTADAVKRLGWALEPAGVDMMLTTELMDVAGPRIMVTPTEGMSLVHVDAPRFSGPRYVLKSTIDWFGALAITVVLAPVMIGIAAAVAMTSRGPVLYRQERVGRNGDTFGMLKFRSMRTGADAEVAELAAENDGSGPLFKMRDDPRVTRLGKVLRRYSLDELPQLFNVLRGQMSLVGPRPPLPVEVSAYEDHVHRRLLVKPGLTGLWQVGGRSDLSWDASVRLDVYYVENWTIFLDLMLIAKTARAIVSGSGAY